MKVTIHAKTSYNFVVRRGCGMRHEHYSTIKGNVKYPDYH
jgi:hypothetical protein